MTTEHCAACWPEVRVRRELVAQGQKKAQIAHASSESNKGTQTGDDLQVLSRPRARKLYCAQRVPTARRGCLQHKHVPPNDLRVGIDIK